MNHRDIAVLMDGIAPVLRGYVEKAFEPIGARMLALEKRFSELPAPRDGKDADPVLILRLVEETVAKVPPAPAGPPGKDADLELVAELVSRAVAALEPPKDGARGPAGESVTLEQLAPLVAEVVAQEVAKLEIPAGPAGEKGETGKGLTPEDIAPLVDDIVLRRVAELPVAKDGAPGRDGRDGLPGVQGEKGLDGRHGIDGKDGFGIDDFDVGSTDDGRTLEFSFKREGAEPIIKQVSTGAVLDRGVWREQAYAKGDGVTWGGSFFIAKRAAGEADKPGASDSWRLSIKKGRDGKDGAPGKPGERGLKGEPGRNFV